MAFVHATKTCGKFFPRFVFETAQQYSNQGRLEAKRRKSRSASKGRLNKQVVYVAPRNNPTLLLRIFWQPLADCLFNPHSQ